MSCSSVDLKAYFLGELAAREKSAVNEHVRACEGCREELDRLGLTQSALMSLQDEEIPQRIAFVSDKVFEPRWWQTIWRSGPVMGFASAALVAAAIVVHAFAGTAASRPVTVAVDTKQIEQVVERQVSARLDAAVTKAVADNQERQSREFAKVLATVENRYEAKRRQDLAVVQQAATYYEKQMSRMQVAFNGERAGQ